MNKLLAISRQPRVKLIAKFSAVYLIFLALSWHKLDLDFGWHLKSGDYYRQHGIPAHDIYTYTARGFSWINHEWGNDLILSFIYSAGGFGLAAIFYAGLWTGGLVVGAKNVRFIFLLAATAAVLPYAGIRPIAWTFLLFAVLLNLLAHKKHPPYWTIGLLFVLWANVHAGFIAGLGVILYYLCTTRDKYFAKLFGISFLATLINPYGARLYVEVGRTLLDSQLHNQVDEWHSFLIFNSSFAFVGLWLAGFFVYRRRPLSNWLGIGPLLFAAALSASRNLPLFVAATANDLEEFYQKFRREAPKKLSLSAKLFLWIPAAVFVGAIVYFSYPAVFFWQDREANVPLQAISYLNAHPCSGNLFNDYDYGGYLIWLLPSEPLYIDGRMPSWRDSNGQKYLNRYFAIIKDPASRKKEFSEYNVQCVLIRSSTTKFIKSLEGNGWKQVVQSNGGTLLEKN